MSEHDSQSFINLYSDIKFYLILLLHFLNYLDFLYFLGLNLLL